MKWIRSQSFQAAAIHCLGVLWTSHKRPNLSHLRQVRGVKASDRATPDDANAFDQLIDSRTASSRKCNSIGSDSLPRSTLVFDANHRRKSSRISSLDRAKNRVSGVVRVVDDHSARID